MNIFLHIVTSSFIGSRCSFPHAVTAHPVSRDCAFPHTLILLQKAVDVIFDMSLRSFKEQLMLLSICWNCCFTIYWIWFSTCCHCPISKSNGCCFPGVSTAHLISSGWISICCHCCFTMQLMWFSTCCYCPLSKAVDLIFCMLSWHT